MLYKTFYYKPKVNLIFFGYLILKFKIYLIKKKSNLAFETKVLLKLLIKFK